MVYPFTANLATHLSSLPCGKNLLQYFAGANANCEKCGSPHKIDNRESQQSLPRRAMGFGFHSGFLPARCQLPRLIAHTSQRTRKHGHALMKKSIPQGLKPKE